MNKIISPSIMFAKIYIAFCWAWLVLVLVTFPTPTTEVVSTSMADKLVHVVLFGVFAYLVSNIFSAAKYQNLKYIIGFSLIITVLYAGLAEYVQIYIPGRSASDMDMLAGIAGAGLSQLIFYVRYK